MIRPGSREHSARITLLVAGDALIAWGALIVSVIVRRTVPMPFTRSLLPPENLVLDLPTVALFAVAFSAGLALAGFYKRRMMARSRPILPVALAIQTALIAVGATLLEHPLPRTILFAVLLLEAIAFPLWRALLERVWPIRRRDTILVGEPDEVESAVAVLERFGESRIHITGYAGRGEAGVAVPWLGPLADPQVRGALRDVEEVILVASRMHDDRLDLLRIRGPRGYLLLASPVDALLAPSVLGWMGDEPLIEVMIGCGFGIRAAIKRFIDIVLSTLLVIVSFPLWSAIVLALLLDDGRPVLLRQLRLGRGSVPFRMWKFRSMRESREGVEESDGQRTTRVGRLLRRYRLDELPQLINVITGEMSLVGPRPERPELAAKILEDVPDFDLRCLVRPGIAGLAQTHAEYDARPAVKLRYDITYMCSWTPWLDVRLLLSSVAAALSGSGI